MCGFGGCVVITSKGNQDGLRALSKGNYTKGV